MSNKKKDFEKKLKSLKRKRGLNNNIRISSEDDLLILKRKITKFSLFIFSKDNRIRDGILRITVNKYFLYFINIVVILSSFFLILETSDDPQIMQITNIFSIIFWCIYVLELIFKVISFGFVLDDYSYLRDPWNVLDLIIVVSGVFSFFPKIEQSLFIIRMFKIFRPMKSLSTLPHMRAFISSLLISLLDLFIVFVILLFFFIIFALMGVSLWSDIFDYRCRTGSIPINGTLIINTSFPLLCGGENLCGNEHLCLSSKEIYANSSYFINPQANKNGFDDELYSPQLNYGLTNFRNFLNGMYIVFQSTTLEGWSFIMYIIMSANNKVLAAFYFIFLIILNNYFLLNLLVAILLFNFEKNYKIHENVEDVNILDIIKSLKSNNRKTKSAISQEEGNLSSIKSIKNIYANRKRSVVKVRNLDNVMKIQEEFNNNEYEMEINNESNIDNDNSLVNECFTNPRTPQFKFLTDPEIDLTIKSKYSSQPNFNYNLNNLNCFSVVDYKSKSNYNINNTDDYFWNENVIPRNINKNAIIVNNLNKSNAESLSQNVNSLRSDNHNTKYQFFTSLFEKKNHEYLCTNEDGNEIKNNILTTNKFGDMNNLGFFKRQEYINSRNNLFKKSREFLLSENINSNTSLLNQIKKDTFEDNQNYKIAINKNILSENIYLDKEIKSRINEKEYFNDDYFNKEIISNQELNSLKKLSQPISNNLNTNNDIKNTYTARSNNIKKSPHSHDNFKTGNRTRNFEQNKTMSPNEILDRLKKYRKNYQPIKIPQTNVFKIFTDHRNFVKLLKDIKFFIHFRPSREYHKSNRFAFYCYYIINQPIVQYLIYFCIIFNFAILLMDRKGQSDAEVDFIEIANKVLVFIFFAETLLLLIGKGLKMFFSNAFNVFDLLIVIFSLVEIIFLNDQMANKSNMSVASSFRILRILRVLKLIRSWHSFKIMILSIANTVKRMINYFILLFIFIYIYAIIGVNIFKGSLKFNKETLKYDKNADSSDDNFDNFINSYLLVFELIVGDGWINTFFDCLRSDANNKYMTIIYFLSLILIGQISMFNIFLAYLIDNFKISRRELFKNIQVKEYISLVAKAGLDKHRGEIIKYHQRNRFKSPFIALINLFRNDTHNIKDVILSSKINFEAKIKINFNHKDEKQSYFRRPKINQLQEDDRKNKKKKTKQNLDNKNRLGTKKVKYDKSEDFEHLYKSNCYVLSKNNIPIDFDYIDCIEIWREENILEAHRNLMNVNLENFNDDKEMMLMCDKDKITPTIPLNKDGLDNKFLSRYHEKNDSPNEIEENNFYENHVTIAYTKEINHTFSKMNDNLYPKKNFIKHIGQEQEIQHYNAINRKNNDEGINKSINDYPLLEENIYTNHNEILPTIESTNSRKFLIKEKKEEENIDDFNYNSSFVSNKLKKFNSIKDFISPKYDNQATKYLINYYSNKDNFDNEKFIGEKNQIKCEKVSLKYNDFDDNISSLDSERNKGIKIEHEDLTTTKNSNTCNKVKTNKHNSKIFTPLTNYLDKDDFSRKFFLKKKNIENYKNCGNEDNSKCYSCEVSVKEDCQSVKKFDSHNKDNLVTNENESFILEIENSQLINNLNKDLDYGILKTDAGGHNPQNNFLTPVENKNLKNKNIYNLSLKRTMSSYQDKELEAGENVEKIFKLFYNKNKKQRENDSYSSSDKGKLNIGYPQINKLVEFSQDRAILKTVDKCHKNETSIFKNLEFFKNKELNQIISDPNHITNLLKKVKTATTAACSHKESEAFYNKARLDLTKKNFHLKVPTIHINLKRADITQLNSLNKFKFGKKSFISNKIKSSEANEECNTNNLFTKKNFTNNRLMVQPYYTFKLPHKDNLKNLKNHSNNPHYFNVENHEWRSSDALNDFQSKTTTKKSSVEGQYFEKIIYYRNFLDNIPSQFYGIKDIKEKAFLIENNDSFNKLLFYNINLDDFLRNLNCDKCENILQEKKKKGSLHEDVNEQYINHDIFLKKRIRKNLGKIQLNGLSNKIFIKKNSNFNVEAFCKDYLLNDANLLDRINDIYILRKKEVSCRNKKQTNFIQSDKNLISLNLRHLISNNNYLMKENSNNLNDDNRLSSNFNRYKSHNIHDILAHNNLEKQEMSIANAEKENKIPNNDELNFRKLNNDKKLKNFSTNNLMFVNKENFIYNNSNNLNDDKFHNLILKPNSNIKDNFDLDDVKSEKSYVSRNRSNHFKFDNLQYKIEDEKIDFLEFFYDDNNNLIKELKKYEINLDLNSKENFEFYIKIKNIFHKLSYKPLFSQYNFDKKDSKEACLLFNYIESPYFLSTFQTLEDKISDIINSNLNNLLQETLNKIKRDNFRLAFSSDISNDVFESDERGKKEGLKTKQSFFFINLKSNHCLSKDSEHFERQKHANKKKNLMQRVRTKLIIRNLRHQSKMSNWMNRIYYNCRNYVFNSSLGIFHKDFRIRKFIARLVLSDKFEYIIMIFILCNCIFLILDNPWNNPEDWLTKAINITNMIFTFIFAIEAILKIISFGLLFGQKDIHEREIFNFMKKDKSKYPLIKNNLVINISRNNCDKIIPPHDTIQKGIGSADNSKSKDLQTKENFSPINKRRSNFARKKSSFNETDKNKSGIDNNNNNNNNNLDDKNIKRKNAVFILNNINKPKIKNQLVTDKQFKNEKNRNDKILSPRKSNNWNKNNNESNNQDKCNVNNIYNMKRNSADQVVINRNNFDNEKKNKIKTESISNTKLGKEVLLEKDNSETKQSDNKTKEINFTLYHGYLYHVSNIIDLIVVIFGVIDVISIDDFAVAKYLRTIRILRSIRPIRIITKSSNLKLIISCLLKSIPAIGNMLIIGVLFILIYAVIGINLFKNSMDYYCQDIHIIDQDTCLEKNLAWYENSANFNNIISALLSLFQLLTRENWVSQMNLAYFKTQSFTAYIYFLSYIIFANFFILNLFISVIIDKFKILKEQKNMLFDLSEEEKDWIKVQKIMLKFNPKIKLNEDDLSYWQIKVLRIVDDNKFEFLSLFFILFAIIILAMQYNGSYPEFDLVLLYCNYVITIFFNLELAAKIFSYRKHFFISRWNIFDFFIIIICNVILILNILEQLEIVTNSSKLSTLPGIFRALRILRVLRLFVIYPTLRSLIDTLVYLVPSIMNIGLIMIILFIIYGCIGVNLFATVPYRENIHEYNNFRNFPNALLLLFRVTTGDDWSSIMNELAYHDCRKKDDVFFQMFNDLQKYNQSSLYINKDDNKQQNNFFNNLNYPPDKNINNNNINNEKFYMVETELNNYNFIDGVNSINNNSLTLLQHPNYTLYENFINKSINNYFCVTYNKTNCYLDDNISYSKLINGKGYSCGSDFSYFYFVSFIILGPIFVMNLCIVMVVEGFSESMLENESLLSQSEMDKFISVWINYDKSFVKTVKPYEMVLILKELEPPLGLNYDRFFILNALKANKNQIQKTKIKKYFESSSIKNSSESRRRKTLELVLGQENKICQNKENENKIEINLNTKSGISNIIHKSQLPLRIIKKGGNIYNCKNFWFNNNLKFWTYNTEVIRIVDFFGFNNLHTKKSEDKKNQKIDSNNNTSNRLNDIYEGLNIHFVDACLSLSKYITSKKHKIIQDSMRDTIVGKFTKKLWMKKFRMGENFKTDEKSLMSEALSLRFIAKIKDRLTNLLGNARKKIYLRNADDGF